MIRACIFDLDGVIVDTARYHFLAWNRLAKELGFFFSETDNELLKGVSRMRSLDILLETGGMDLPVDQKEILAARKNEWYLELIRKMTPDEILPGVPHFLKLLKAEGVPAAIGTASKNAGLILKQIGMEHAFDCLIDGYQVTQAKPDPEVFLKAAFSMGMTPEECVVFEDAQAGIEAAHRGGMKCIGVGDPVVLKTADKVIPGFTEINLNILLF
jgi:beta-phosphoglucomutase